MSGLTPPPLHGYLETNNLMATLASLKRPRRRRLEARERWEGWLFAAPTALLVLCVFVIPLVLVFVIAASDWQLRNGFQGINFPTNFTDALAIRFLWDAIVFTLKYTVIVTVILLGIALGLALIVQESSRGKTLLRTAFLVPSALGLASASLLFYVLYSPYAGPFAGLMKAWGFTFLGTPDGALWSTIFLIVWRFAGFYMLLMLVGLQGIPEDVYEAARMDGASVLQTFWSITLPLLRPTLALTTVLCVTGSLLAFEQFYILTKGGPENSTFTVVTLVVNEAFGGRFALGPASALSILILIALILINVLQLRVLRRSSES